jgi:hypothetical protein
MKSGLAPQAKTIPKKITLCAANSRLLARLSFENPMELFF